MLLVLAVVAVLAVGVGLEVLFGVLLAVLVVLYEGLLALYEGLLVGRV